MSLSDKVLSWRSFNYFWKTW